MPDIPPLTDEQKSMVESVIPWCHKLGLRYGRHDPSHADDYVQQAMLGAMIAAARFDESRGMKFITYATWWIRSTMNAYSRWRSRHVREQANEHVHTGESDLTPVTDDAACPPEWTPEQWEELLACLTPSMRERFVRRVIRGETMSGIARDEGVAREAVRLSVEKAKQRLSRQAFLLAQVLD